jgi:hypothetical protein
MPFLNRVFLTIILGALFCGSASWGQAPLDPTVQTPGLDSPNPAQVPRSSRPLVF